MIFLLYFFGCLGIVFVAAYGVMRLEEDDRINVVSAVFYILLIVLILTVYPLFYFKMSLDDYYDDGFKAGYEEAVIKSDSLGGNVYEMRIDTNYYKVKL
jgi:multisubunit Na+/H+ antiporter MnhB subunit